MQGTETKRHGRRYPWSKWFASGTFSLVRDVDFDGLAHGMAQMVRNTAALPKFRLRVSVQVVDDHTVNVKVLGDMRRTAPGSKRCRR